MAKVKEIYIWIAFFIVVVAIAGYIRYFYQPSISLSVKFLNTSSAYYYPYQNIADRISVENTGSSAVSNLSFGLYMNSNISRVYKISIPPGKIATINFNFTPSVPGTYAVKFVADPSDLYNIVDRSSAQAGQVFDVAVPENAEPYVLFNKTGLLGEDQYNMSALGYDVAEVVFNFTGNKQFLLTQSSNINAFMYPAIGVYLSYGAIKSIALAHAYYKNYSLVSVWINGPVNEYSLREAAIGEGLNVTTGLDNITLINFGNDTTMCIWYSNGWTKSLGSIAGKNCEQYIANANYESINSSAKSEFKNNGTDLYNYTGFFSNFSYSGEWSVLPNRYVLYQSISKGTNFTNVCDGDIESVYNKSYCNTYYLEPQNAIIVKTNALVGDYNLTAWLVTNSTALSNLSAYNMKLINGYNITGPVSQFVSGFVNTCAFNNYIGCYGSLWNYSKLELGLINGYNSSVQLEGVYCYTAGRPNMTRLNQTIQSGGYTTITTPCYTNGTAISGIALGLHVYLTLLYNENGSTVIAEGNATLVK